MNLHPDEAMKIANQEIGNMEIDYRADFSEQDYSRLLYVKLWKYPEEKTVTDIQETIYKKLKDNGAPVSIKSIRISDKTGRITGAIRTNKRSEANEISQVKIKEDGWDIEFEKPKVRIPKWHNELTILGLSDEMHAFDAKNTILEQIRKQSGVTPTSIEISKGKAFVGSMTTSDYGKILSKVKMIEGQDVIVLRTIEANSIKEKRQLATIQANHARNENTELRETKEMIHMMVVMQQKEIAIRREENERRAEEEQRRREWEMKSEKRMDQMQDQIQQVMNMFAQVINNFSKNTNEKEPPKSTMKRTTSEREDTEMNEYENVPKYPRVESLTNKDFYPYPSIVILTVLCLLICQAQAAGINNDDPGSKLSIAAVNVMCLSAPIILNKLNRWIRDVAPDILIITEHKLRKKNGKVNQINIEGYEWKATSAKSKRMKNLRKRRRSDFNKT